MIRMIHHIRGGSRLGGSKTIILLHMLAWNSLRRAKGLIVTRGASRRGQLRI